MPVKAARNRRVSRRHRRNRSHQVDHRQVGQARIAHVDALRAQDQWAVRWEAGQQLPHQTGLPSRGGDEDRTGTALGRPRHGLGQNGQLGLTADERHVAQ